MSLRDMGRAAAGPEIIAKVLKEQGGVLREGLLDAMLEEGADRVRVRSDDQTEEYGSWTVCGGALKAKVTDPDAFLAWAEELGEVQNVKVVRPAFQKAVLDAATKAGAPVWGAGGEQIPGVTVAPGDPYLSFRATEVAKDRALDLLAGDPLGIRQLAAGSRAGVVDGQVVEPASAADTEG